MVTTNEMIGAPNADPHKETPWSTFRKTLFATVRLTEYLFIWTARALCNRRLPSE